MKIQKDIFTVEYSDGFSCRLSEKTETDGVSVYRFHLGWKTDGLTEDSAFTFRFEEPMNDMLYAFYPDARMFRAITPDWYAPRDSMTSYSAPLSVFYNGRSENVYTWALDECSKHVRFRSGAHEYDGKLRCMFTLPVKQFTGASETDIAVRIDRRRLPIGDVVAAVADWWADDCLMRPAYVPADAKEPVYSFWYSFHQDVSAAAVEEECKKAKQLGFDVCIVDDGWCLRKDEHGYGRAGVWLPDKEKFPDMRAHVKAVHDIGMKYILWFSTSFIGMDSDVAERFADMVLYKQEHMRILVLDPRYKEVREFIAGNFVHAVKEWDLDGVKLDFIDQWKYRADNPPCNERMDIPELSEAVDRLMLNVADGLRSVKPDILIEFRQNYIGPMMRKYGNMFRVADCPNDGMSNRIGVLDLRLLMGKSAVHSDMLTWHPDEKAETAALQVLSAFFGTLQFSQKIDTLSERQYRMVKFYLHFMQSHRHLLQEGHISVYQPEDMYTWAMSTTDDACAVAVYAPEVCIHPPKKDTVYIANACMSDRIILELHGRYACTVYDCTGTVVGDEIWTFDGLSSLPVSVGGLIVLRK